MRPGSILVSGNKKPRSTHNETRRPGPGVLGMNVFIPRRPSGERGNNFIGSSPFTASCLLIVIMQSQELNFLQMTVLSDHQVPLAVWVGQPAKKRRVGSDRRAWRQWSSSLRAEETSASAFCSVRAVGLILWKLLNSETYSSLALLESWLT